MIRFRIRWGLVLAALVLLAGAAPAFAQSDELGVCIDPGSCREECREAQGICHLVAEAARHVCVEACSDDDGGCLRQCVRAHRRAASVCAEERLECRLACHGDHEPGCAADCLSDARHCRAERRACVDDCRAKTRHKLGVCRERFGGDGGNPIKLERCIARVAEAGTTCAQDCREELRCGEELRGCLTGCTDADAPQQ